MQTKISKLDFILFGVSILALLFTVEYFVIISSPNADYGLKDYNPFYDYQTNYGIILIETIRFISWLGIFLIGFVWIIRKKIDYKWVYIIFGLCILIALSRWVEFWYGSTFYYGELRDKHGLSFPLFRLCLIVYVIWRYKLELINKKQIIIKSVASILMLLMFWGFYNLVYDIWKLHQS